MFIKSQNMRITSDEKDFDKKAYDIPFQVFRKRNYSK